MIICIRPRAEVNNHAFGARKRAHVSALLLKMAPRYHPLNVA